MAQHSKMTWSFLNIVCLLAAVVFFNLCEAQPSYIEYAKQHARARNLGVNNTLFDSVRDEIDRLSGMTRQDILNSISRYTAAAPSISQKCLNNVMDIVKAATSKEKWALQIVDSFGKPGSGLELYMLEWFGSYDECINTVIPSNANTSSQFETKYCLAARPVVPGTLNIELGTCFPSTCNETDILLIMWSILKPLSPGLVPSTVICQERSLELDTPATASLIVLGFFAALIIVATAYDVLSMNSTPHEEGSASVNKTYSDQEVHSSSGHYDDQTNMANSLLVSGEYNESPLLGSHLDTGSVLSSKCVGVLKEMLLAFSVYRNGAKLLNTKMSPNCLRSVHRIRFLSMTWVILGHTYFFGEAVFMYENIAYALPKILKRWTFDAIQYATVSVDTFFVLSGLLMAYLSLGEMRRREGRLNWFMFYFHRYIRLTPPYMFVIMIYVPLFKYWGSGPSYAQNGIDPYCKDNFWLNLLYVQNLVHADKQCMGWAWYLANDMQFYILSPLIFVPLYYSKWIGTIVAGLFLVATVTAAGVITSVYNVQFSNLSDYMTIYYVKPYCRMGPYIIGMLAGYLLYRTNCRIRMNKIQCLIGWASTAAICLAVLYGQDGRNHGHIETIQEQALYNALSRTAWGVGVAWVVIACVTGNGGFVNTILSWKALVPLSRLTYCAYLVHPVVMFYFYLSRQTPLYFTDITMIYIFFGHLVASYMVATVISLMFESPILGLEKAILNRVKRS